MKSQNLLGITEICDFFGLSETTIRRKVRASREGKGNFPLPLFQSGCRTLWRRSDVEAWRGEAEVVAFTPSLIPPIPPVQIQNLSQTHKRLEALGVKLPVQPGNESNN